MAAMFLVHSGDMVIKALMVQGCIAISCVFSLTHYHGIAWQSHTKHKWQSQRSFTKHIRPGSKCLGSSSSIFGG